ncbi:ATP-binding protein [Calderihabitans maritimus]|uniref:4Fe-4S ferredoxin n=1 Tax=Calderihabitans maritimus TaxID=1246530 RepID=A0A1Z5HVV6_9FIRM|nr:4Fe-4S binding protein [Calderihabitans maritimus]GAW93679.1 4Fe-4S ferredoxin [Calderihabitans maritimus]
MAIRNIVKIDEDKCNGCGLCVPACAEGAIQIVDGKARLIADRYCDGLGACLGHCPNDAITIIKREAEEFDEEAVKEHLASRKQSSHMIGSCPGSRVMSLEKTKRLEREAESGDLKISIRSQLTQWPVQLMLVPANASFLQNADLLLTADCVPFAYANYHLDLLKGKKVLVGCPKLDDLQYYVGKLTDIFRLNDLRSITVAYMEVPCCSGLVRAVREAMKNAGKSIPIDLVQIGIDGQKQ